LANISHKTQIEEPSDNNLAFLHPIGNIPHKPLIFVEGGSQVHDWLLDDN